MNSSLANKGTSKPEQSLRLSCSTRYGRCL